MLNCESPERTHPVGSCVLLWQNIDVEEARFCNTCKLFSGFEMLKMSIIRTRLIGGIDAD